MYDAPEADEPTQGRSTADYLARRRAHRAAQRAQSPAWRATAALYRKLKVAPSHVRHEVRFAPAPLLPQQAAELIESVKKGTELQARRVGKRKEPTQKVQRSQAKRRRVEAVQAKPRRKSAKGRKPAKPAARVNSKISARAPLCVRRGASYIAFMMPPSCARRRKPSTGASSQ